MKLAPLLEQGTLPIMAGFMGTTPEGKITSLGDDSGDFSSAILAACSDSDELWLWRDIDGVMTGDPAIVTTAVTIPELSYAEIDTLAYFGVNLPLSRHLLPAIDRDIPISIRNAYNPGHPGTRILSQENTVSGVIKAVIANKAVKLIQIEGNLTGSSPVASRASAVLKRQETKILATFQTDIRLGFVVPPSQFETAYTALEAEFKLEPELEVYVEEDVALLTLIGVNLVVDSGIVDPIGAALAAVDVKHIAIGKGISNVSIPVLIVQNDMERAAAALHPLTLTRLTHD